MRTTIRQRLMLGFGILLALLALGCGVGWFKAKTAETRTHALVEVNIAELSAAQTALSALMNAQGDIRQFALTRNTNLCLDVRAEVAELKASVQTMAKDSPSEQRRARAAELATQVENYGAAFDQVVRLTIRRGITSTQGLEG